MKTRKKILGILFFIFLIVLSFFALRGIEIYKAYNVKPLTTEQINFIKSDSADKLMIVAHPDDEVLWGGGHLSEGDYFVVCITCGKNKTRSKEFKKVIEQSGNEGIILSYPDKVNGKRDDWENVKDKMMTDLNYIITAKDWDLIVTHNKDGEYGHAHHKMLHSFVVDVYENVNSDDKLMFFGKYYKASEIDNVRDLLTPLAEDQFKTKTKLFDLYKSQSDVIDNLRHMAEFENWTDYVKTDSDNMRENNEKI